MTLMKHMHVKCVVMATALLAVHTGSRAHAGVRVYPAPFRAARHPHEPTRPCLSPLGFYIWTQEIASIHRSSHTPAYTPPGESDFSSDCGPWLHPILCQHTSWFSILTCGLWRSTFPRPADSPRTKPQSPRHLVGPLFSQVQQGELPLPYYQLWMRSAPHCYGNLSDTVSCF